MMEINSTLDSTEENHIVRQALRCYASELQGRIAELEARRRSRLRNGEAEDDHEKKKGDEYRMRRLKVLAILDAIEEGY